MIDIIMPIYNDRKNLSLSLASVAMQTIKNQIAVYLVDDCSTEVYDDILLFFKKDIQINYLKLNTNSGPGVAREYGLKKSKNQFICFIDSDDLLINPRSLETMYKFTKEDFEFISSLEYTERFEQVYNNDKNLHAKIYSRKFIEENNIHFNNARLHEDCYFNSIYNVCNPKSIHIDRITYFHSYNKSALTSVNCNVEFNGLEVFLDNIKQTIDFAIKHNCDKKVIKKVLSPKQEYVERIYNSIRAKEKHTLKKWVTKYNLNDIFNFL